MPDQAFGIRVLQDLGGDAHDAVADFLAENDFGVFAHLGDHFTELQFFFRIGSEGAVFPELSDKLAEQVTIVEFGCSEFTQL